MQEDVVYLITDDGTVHSVPGSITPTGCFRSRQRPDLRLGRDSEGVTWFQNAGEAYERALIAARENQRSLMEAYITATGLVLQLEAKTTEELDRCRRHNGKLE